MANRFTQYSRQKYYELPVDAYQQALGVNEGRTAQQANDLSQNVQFIKNLPAVNGPDKLRLEQIVSGLESGIQGVAKKDLSAAETLNSLNSLVTDRTTNRDAVGIYQNVLGYRKKQKAIEDYEKKFGNNVNTTRLRSQLNEYLGQNDATKFQAGYFDNLSDPMDYVDIKGKVADFVGKLKANKQSVENVNGNWIVKKSVEGQTENDLYQKAYQYFADDPSYSAQFRENAYYDAYNTGGGNSKKGYELISNNYLTGLNSEYKNLESKLSSSKLSPQVKTQINQRLSGLKNQIDQVKTQAGNGNYENIAVYKTRDDLIKNASEPFAYLQEEQSLDVNPYALASFKDELAFKSYSKKLQMMNSVTPITPLTVAEGLAPDQVSSLANNEIQRIFGSPVQVSSDGTKFESNDSKAKNNRLELYKRDEEIIANDIRRKTGKGFTIYTDPEYKERVTAIAKKYGIESRGGLDKLFTDRGSVYAKDVPEDYNFLNKRLEQLAISNPELKKHTDRKDYVGAYKLYKSALEDNLKMNESYVISNGTGYNNKLLPTVMAGLTTQPVYLITPDGKYDKTEGLNGVLEKIGALTNSQGKPATLDQVNKILYNPNNIMTYQKSTGMMTVQMGQYKIAFTPPKQIATQFDGLNNAAFSTKQGRLNVQGQDLYVTPKIVNGKMQQVIYQPITAPEQLSNSVNWTKTSTFKQLENSVPASSRQNIEKAFKEISKAGNISDTFLIDPSTGNIVSESQALNNQGKPYVGVTVQKQNGIRTVQLTKMGDYNLNQLYDYKFNQLNSPGGGLYNFRQTNKTKNGMTVNPMMMSGEDNSDYQESDE